MEPSNCGKTGHSYFAEDRIFLFCKERLKMIISPKADTGKTMKIRRIIIVAIIIFIPMILFAGEFKWARVKFDIIRNVPDKWDVIMQNDLEFLNAVAAMINTKVSKKVNIVSFNELDQVCKYPLLFMTAEEKPVFSEKEIKNMKEYLNRGGIIWGDDCLLEQEPLFILGFKEILETKVFPGKKMEKPKNDHEIFRCFFKLQGLPYMRPVNAKSPNGYLLFNEKGKIMVFLEGSDLHCGWSTEYNYGKEKTELAYKMGINIIIYALTH